MKALKPGEIICNKTQIRNLLDAFKGDVPEKYIMKALRMKKDPIIKIYSKAINLEEAEKEYFYYLSKRKKDSALEKFFSFNPSEDQIYEMYNKVEFGSHRRWAIRSMFRVQN